MKKNIKPVDLFIQTFIKTQKDYYYAMLKEMKAMKKAKLKIHKV